jgi:hypothetical protein
MTKQATKQKGVRCPKRGRSRTTNRPTATRKPGSDRSRHRRVNDLYRAYMRKLPDDDANAQETAWRAAELTVIAEDLRAKIIAGSVAHDAELIRTENTAARARREVAALADPHKGEKTLADVLLEISTPVDGIEPVEDDMDELDDAGIGDAVPAPNNENDQ